MSKYVCINEEKLCFFTISQLSGGLFSPSDVWKKLSQTFLLYFLFGIVSAAAIIETRKPNIYFGLAKSFDQQNLFLFPKYFLKDQNYFGQSKKTTAKMSIL